MSWCDVSPKPIGKILTWYTTKCLIIGVKYQRPMQLGCGTLAESDPKQT